MSLQSYAVFVEIIEKGSMAAAARELNLSTTTVSERLAALEDEYGAQLIRRTTRSLSLTEAGAVFLEGARRLLGEAKQLDSAIRNGAEALSGSIRFSMPTDLGHRHLLPLIDQFARVHPKVVIDLILSDANVDLIREGLDFAVRDSLVVDTALTSRIAVDNPRVVCASPAYIEKYGAPMHPDELDQHCCLLLRVGNTTNRFWRFMIDGREREVALSGARITNDAGLIARWCRTGQGIAIKSKANVMEDIATGALVPILADFLPPPGAFQILYPSGRALPRRVAALIDLFEVELRKISAETAR